MKKNQFKKFEIEYVWRCTNIALKIRKYYIHAYYEENKKNKYEIFTKKSFSQR